AMQRSGQSNPAPKIQPAHARPETITAERLSATVRLRSSDHLFILIPSLLCATQTSAAHHPRLCRSCPLSTLTACLIRKPCPASSGLSGSRFHDLPKVIKRIAQRKPLRGKLLTVNGSDGFVS